MNLSTIKSMLSGELHYQEFKAMLALEMTGYLSGAKERGKSRPVYVNDDIDVMITKSDLNSLCTAFLNDFLNETEINYTADILLLSNRVEFNDDDILDRLGYLTDPEINGPLTKDYVESLLQR